MQNILVRQYKRIEFFKKTTRNVQMSSCAGDLPVGGDGEALGTYGCGLGLESH